MAWMPLEQPISTTPAEGAELYALNRLTTAAQLAVLAGVEKSASRI